MKKSTLNKVKQATAGLLTLAMVATGLPPMEARAATLQPNGNLNVAGAAPDGISVQGNFTYGSSDNTAYVFGSSTTPKNHADTNNYGTAGAGDPFTFNIAAITNDSYRSNASRGYYSDATVGANASTTEGQPDLKSAYGDSWWHGYYAFGKPHRIGTDVQTKSGGSPYTPAANALDPVVTAWSGSMPTTATFGTVATGAKKALHDTGGPYKNGDVQTIAIPGGSGNLEVRQEIKASDDKQYVLVTYTVYNNSNSNVDFMVGNESDTMLGTHDDVPIFITRHGAGEAFEGLHFQNKSFGDKSSHAIFDIISEGKDVAGMQRNGANDKSENRVWGGSWSRQAGVDHTDWVFTQSRSGYVAAGRSGTSSTGDTAAAFSAYFQLSPYEQKASTFALAIKPYVFYVKPGAGAGGNGFMGTPVGSIQEALDVLASKPTDIKKAYIYLQGDVELSNTITMPAGRDITIQTTDYDALVTSVPNYNTIPLWTDDTPVPHDSSQRYTIKRAAGFTGPLFQVNQGSSTLNFLDVIVDGNGGVQTAAAPLVEVSAGKLSVKQNADLQNNKVDVDDVASAIHLTGTTSTLELTAPTKPAVIKDNVSLKNGSAIIVDSTAANPVSISGNVQVTENTQVNGSVTTKANVDLKTHHLWVPTGKTFTGDISVRVTNVPDATEKGTMVADYEDRASNGAMPYSASNFKADLTGQSIQGGNAADIDMADGSNQLTGRIYLRVSMRDFSLSYVDQNGNNIPVGSLSGLQAGVTTNPYTKSMAAGSALEYALPTYTGYKVSKVESTPNTALTTDPGGAGTINPGDPNAVPSTLGKITGTLPDGNVDVVVTFAPNEVRYYFDSQGGSAVAQQFEQVRAPGLPSLLTNWPQPTKAGFDFQGWYLFDDVAGDDHEFKPADGDVDLSGGTAMAGFAEPNTAKIYHLYAKWEPGSTTYEVRSNFRNSSPSLVINFGSTATRHQITRQVTKDPVTIPGYKYVTSTLAPVSAGTLTVATGHLDIPSMPANNVNVNYKYSPDPTQTFPFTVRHVDGGGTLIQGNTITSQRRAEQSITAMPRTDLTGYTYDHFTIDAGNYSDLSNYIIGFNDFPHLVLKKDDQSGGTGEFSAFMPNQAVTVTYYYTADAGMNLVRRYADGVTGKILLSRINPVTPAQNVSIGFTDGITTELYGYVFNGSYTVVPAGSLNIDGSGNITGTMPATGNAPRVDYHLGRDASKWRDINFAVANAPYENGSINPLPAGAPTSFLANDGSMEGIAAAYNFNKLKTDGYVPNITPNRYYMFDGWFLDAAATMPVSDTQTFETSATPLTLYAKFVEDPSQWYDIHFVSGSNGSISAPASLHKPYDYTWGQIAGEIPTATPVVNYLFAAWTGPGGAVMGAASTLTNNATYTANFSKDPSVWGTNVGSFTGSGHIGYDGSGEIHINGSTPGNVYVISDMKGQIVAVVKGDPNGSLTIARDLIPGAHYNVQEGLPDTQATVGQPVSSVTGSSVSAPQDVYIPTVEDNYNVGYDPENEGMAQIVINPADPDAEYALIDEAGNVLKYPGSDNGWMKPVGSNPSTVTFNNLNPNETYTVVARKKGDTSIPDPLAKLPDGNQIVANPGDMADAQKYIVETRNGIVVSVGDTSVNGDAFDQAKPGDVVNIHADATNASGKAFKYWQVLAGRAVGVSGNITQNDYTFTLSRSNIVLKAVYEADKLYGDDANLYEEIRGGALGEFGLEPYQLANLAHELTTDADRELNSVNGATVDYKIVFNKRDASKTESNLVKPVSESGTRHQDAYTAAYALDILLERYVNGRKVDRATASNAVVDVIAQLPANDTDQLDYQLFDVTSGTPVEVTLTGDVANNAGLLKFTGNVTHTYVLVYSKVFKLVFLDNKPVLDHLHLGDTSRNFYHRFKVRRKESVEDSYYDHDYGVVTAYAKNETAVALKSPFEDIYGVQYDYLNWSKKEDTLSAYDTTSPVTKALVLYAYYKNNKPEVTQARIDLGNTIEEAQELRMDPYLKAGEAAHIAEAITVAQETLRRARGLLDASGNDYLRMANYEELQQAIRALRELLDRYKDIIAQRTANRNSRTGGSSGGGGSSYGKGSLLLDPGQKYTTKNRAALEASNVLSFVLGVDGNWARNPVTGGWSFVLNGGQPLNTFWGRISFPDATGRLINKWYYFDGQSTMVTGWLKDPTTGNWFFMNTDKNANEGQMVTGWIEDAATGKWYFMNEVTGVMMTGWQQGPQDGRWYYLGADGAMLTGWQEINGKLYYFNPVAAAPTYTWNAQTMHWDLTNSNARPYGAMYANEMTPDGHRVGADGARQ